MAITAAQVKQLRETTGVGMMECKSALVATDGDQEKAIIWLRERGMSRAQKKAGRTAAEGIVVFALSSDNKKGTLLELNCETDFAAKNADFSGFSNEITQIAMANNINSIEELNTLPFRDSNVEDQLAQLIAKVGENMNLRRVVTLNAPQGGFVVGYNHMNGKIGTLVSLKGDLSNTSMEVALDLAMHVAASAPKYLNRDLVDASELEQEKELARVNLRSQGKPEDLIEKILVGQVNKFYSEVTFIDQPFVKEPKFTVNQYIANQKLGLILDNFARFQLGEGIEVEKRNFAEEVSEQLNK